MSDPRDSNVEGAPVWIEIPATGHVTELKKFYQELFPAWNFTPPPHGEEPDESKIAHYQSTPTGLTGGILKMPEGCKSQPQPMGIGPTVYYKVFDLDRIEKRVHELGGTTCLERQYDGVHGYFMNFRDPQGNRFGAFQLVYENTK